MNAQIYAPFFEGDETAHALLQKYAERIRAIIAYRLQYFSSKVELIEVPVSREVLFRHPRYQDRLSFLVRTRVTTRPILDDQFAEVTVTKYLLPQCPEFSDTDFSMWFRGRLDHGGYRHLGSGWGQLRKEVEDLLDRVEAHRRPDA